MVKRAIMLGILTAGIAAAGSPAWAQSASAGFLDGLAPDEKKIITTIDGQAGDMAAFCGKGKAGFKDRAVATGAQLANGKEVKPQSVTPAIGPTVKYFSMKCGEAGFKVE